MLIDHELLLKPKRVEDLARDLQLLRSILVERWAGDFARYLDEDRGISLEGLLTHTEALISFYREHQEGRRC